MLRGLVLLVLALSMAGFGVCSLCGGVMGVSWLIDGNSRDRGYAEAALVMSAIGAVIAALSWWGYRTVKRRGGSAAAEPPAPGAQ